MFGANLRQLADGRGSISALSRDLGINRTQLNRYLSGESFPRPDVLGRICTYFGVDARVLLEPVDQISRVEGPLSTGHMKPFMGTGVTEVTEEALPSGYYCFSRRSFVNSIRFVRGLVFVHRVNSNTFVKGYEPKDAMAVQGIPTALAAREYRGFVLKLDDGIAATVCRHNGMTASFNYLTRVTSFENNFWVGYVARTVAETPTSSRMTRLVYEFLGTRIGPALRIARHAGFCDFEDLLPFHQRLLQPEAPFR